jgi:hypothetical protein
MIPWSWERLYAAIWSDGRLGLSGLGILMTGAEGCATQNGERGTCSESPGTRRGSCVGFLCASFTSIG